MLTLAFAALLSMGSSIWRSPPHRDEQKSFQWYARPMRIHSLAVLLALCSPALATSYVVSPTGDDTADGSSAHPWKTLQHAADQVNAGDDVTVQAGTYVGFELGFSNPKSGSAGQPIVFTAQAGVLINAPNHKTADGIDLEGASYVTLDGFEVTGVTRAGIRTVWDGNANATDVTVRNCYP